MKRKTRERGSRAFGRTREQTRVRFLSVSLAVEWLCNDSDSLPAIRGRKNRAGIEKIDGRNEEWVCR